MRRVALQIALWLCAVPALASARIPFGSFVAAIDLDGDLKSDLATAAIMRRDGASYLVDLTFRLSSVEAGRVTVRTPAIAGRLTARDLDGDADRDLILESFDREPLAVILNDGGGHFHQVDLDAYRSRLRRSGSTDFEAPASENDAPCSFESPASPAAAPAPGANDPALTTARQTRLCQPRFVASDRAVRTSRAPPAVR